MTENGNDDTSPGDYTSRQNKRKALRYLLRQIKDEERKLNKPFIYVTLAADKVLDVRDLLSYFNLEDLLKIFAYEEIDTLAEKAANSEIVMQLNMYRKEPILEVIQMTFPEGLRLLLTGGENHSKIYFFDITGWFDTKYASMIYYLLKREFLGSNDYFIITSSLDNFGWRPIKPKAQKQYTRHNLGREKNTDENVLKHNIAELFVELGLNKYNAYDKEINGGRRQVNATSTGKVRYRDDGHTTMGVWAFYFSSGAQQKFHLPKEFNKEYVHGEEPRLFRNLFNQ